MLEGRPGVALLAHLRSGSIRVHVGQSVSMGEPLGEVGNSGNSTLPHLHFQVMDGRDPLKAKGIPCKFQKYQKFNNGVWEDVSDSIPQERATSYWPNKETASAM
ncbi:MAG: M23 family metallopeptidase [Acidobacteria bacterium]|nr:M23 family metallopeptidase [Acidobacteriota bacterium]